MGVVYAAIDTELDRPVALKFPRLGPPELRPADRSRFRREIRAAAQLDHPGVVPVFASGQDADGRPYYAMRRIAGPNMGAAIADFHSPRGRRRHESAERALAFRAC